MDWRRDFISVWSGRAAAQERSRENHSAHLIAKEFQLARNQPARRPGCCCFRVCSSPLQSEQGLFSGTPGIGNDLGIVAAVVAGDAVAGRRRCHRGGAKARNDGRLSLPAVTQHMGSPTRCVSGRSNAGDWLVAWYPHWLVADRFERWNRAELEIVPLISASLGWWAGLIGVATHPSTLTRNLLQAMGLAVTLSIIASFSLDWSL